MCLGTNSLTQITRLEVSNNTKRCYNLMKQVFLSLDKVRIEEFLHSNKYGK